MKRKILYMLALAAAVMFGFTQCTDPVDEITLEQQNFIGKTVYGVYGTSDLFTYTEQGCQYAMGNSELSVRVQTDSMDKYYSVTFASEPEVDKDVSATVVTNVGGNVDGTRTVTIMKMEDGKVWVWDKADKKGYLLPWK